MAREITDYTSTLQKIKEQVYQAQNRALKVVNSELVSLYWNIGKIVSEKQKKEGWGKSTVERLSKDLQIEFPGIKGFSVQNLWYMKQFYDEYKGKIFLQTLSGEMGWSQNILILKLKTDEEKQFYMEMTRKYGWSVRMLERQIESNLFRQAKSNQENFAKTLSKKQAVLAKQNLKDNYNFDFLEIGEQHSERELEDALLSRICDFLKELGGNFCFVDRQYRVEISEKEYFIDILFYNRELQCLFALELKTGEFKAEYASKMNMYLSALDDKVKRPHEKSSIGIIICKSKDETVVEYTLRGMGQPLGISTYSQYKTLKDIPAEVAKYLPKKEEIVKRLSG